MKIYHKKAFDKIDPAKRERILATARREFARNGYRGTNIKKLAAKAGISIGGMYKYFGSKKDLYLTILSEAYAMMARVFGDIEQHKSDVFAKIDIILESIQRAVPPNQDLIRIYLDSTTDGNAELSHEFARHMETISAEFYRDLIAQAQAEGRVDPGLDPHVAALCLDNVFMINLFSHASSYYQERLRLYAGQDNLDNPDALRAAMLRFLRNALAGDLIK